MFFIKLFWYKEKVLSLFAKYLLYSCICQQAENSDHFKGHRLTSPESLWIKLQWRGAGGGGVNIVTRLLQAKLQWMQETYDVAKQLVAIEGKII